MIDIIPDKNFLIELEKLRKEIKENPDKYRQSHYIPKPDNSKTTIIVSKKTKQLLGRLKNDQFVPSFDQVIQNLIRGNNNKDE